MTIDEKVIAALISGGSVRRAAQILDMAPSKVQKRLENEAFRERYEQAKADVLRQTLAALTDSLTQAVQALRDVVSDEAAPQSQRIAAADTLLRHSLRYLQAVDFERRIAALEQQMINEGGG